MAKAGFLTTLLTAAALTTLLIVAAGCRSNAVSGVYANSTGNITIEFRDHKAFLNMGGISDPDGTPYDVHGNKITVHWPKGGMLGGDTDLTINSDGTLQGPMGILHKK
jgi:hypothetical protein